MIRACQRFAKNMGLDIIETDTAIAIKEAADDDDELWVDKQSPDPGTVEEFIRMCISYGKQDIRVPIGKISIMLTCPNCNTFVLTPQQYMINSIAAFDRTYIMCNSCGEIVKVTNKVNIT